MPTNAQIIRARNKLQSHGATQSALLTPRSIQPNSGPPTNWSSQERATAQLTERALTLMVLSTLGLVGGMIASCFFVGPAGQRITILGFIQLWFREIVFSLIGVLAIVLAVVAKFQQLLKVGRGK